MSNWVHKGQDISSIEQMPVGTIGFVYVIEDINTREWYIGKKMITSNRTLPPLKGQTKKRKVVKESDWKGYQSSNKTVRDWFSPKKTILKYCFTKKQLTYWENQALYCTNALLDQDCLNDNISGKFFKGEVL